MENLEMNPIFWKDKRVLITGHSGFKGSWLSLWLQRIGAKVTGYALAPPTVPNLFSQANIPKGMHSIQGNVKNLKKLVTVLKESRSEIIIHMAAQPLVIESYNDPVETYSTNVLGTVNLLEATRQSKEVKVFINVTTDKVYENKEWIWGYREFERLGGFDPYSNSKACSEFVTASYRNSFFPPSQWEEHGVAVATARAGNVIGGGDWGNDRLVPDCIRAWLDRETVNLRYPNAIRPWQHVLEPLNGYLVLAENLHKNGETFSEAWNFGPDEGSAQSVQHVVDRLSKFWGADAKWAIDSDHHAHEATYLKLDYTKASEKLDWRPQWNLDTTLEKTADWYIKYLTNPSQLRGITFDQIDEYMDSSKSKAI
jgi:CDP-glucose 4,6-dehydratase